MIRWLKFLFRVHILHKTVQLSAREAERSPCMRVRVRVCARVCVCVRRVVASRKATQQRPPRPPERNSRGWFPWHPSTVCFTVVILPERFSKYEYHLRLLERLFC